MPLDASLFMQYAALRDSQNKQLQASIGSGLDSAYKNKALKIEEEKAKNAGFDLDKLATPALIKMQMGETLTPQDTAILKAWDLSETRKLAPDATGNYRKINASIFDPGMGSGKPQGFDLGNIAPVPSVESMPSSFIGGTNDAVSQAPAPAVPFDVSMLQPTGDPNMDAYRAKMFEENQAMVGDALPAVGGTNSGEFLPPVAEKVSGFDTNLVAPQREPITVPPELAGNPNATQKYLESAAAAEGALSADVAKAGAIETAKKVAEKKINSDAQIDSVDSAISSLDAMANDLGGAPSGALEGMAAKAANFAGFPTDASKSQARYESRVPLLAAKLKKFIRDPGEGNFTDADQKNLMMMMPDDKDSTPVKYEKLMAVSAELKRLKAEKTGANSSTPQARGFKYLGTE